MDKKKNLAILQCFDDIIMKRCDSKMPSFY